MNRLKLLLAGLMLCGGALEAQENSIACQSPGATQDCVDATLDRCDVLRPADQAAANACYYRMQKEWSDGIRTELRRVTTVNAGPLTADSEKAKFNITLSTLIAPCKRIVASDTGKRVRCNASVAGALYIGLRDTSR